jgi:hypothetical protein
MRKILALAILAILAVDLLVGCVPRTSPSAMHGPAAPSTTGDGTSDAGGGGNISPEKQLSVDEIESVIKDLRYTITPVLFRMEDYGVTYDQALKVFKEKKYPKPEEAAHHLIDVLEKMFSEPDVAVYSILKQVRFVAFAAGACHDLKNADKDGSAFNLDPIEVCISVSRLRTKVTHLTEQSEVLALAIHELSHRAGASEEEAQAVQFMVLQQFGSATPESMNSAFDALLDSPHWELGSFKKQLLAKDPNSIPELCLNIGENFRDLDRIYTKKTADANTLGVMFERPIALRVLRAARDQSLELEGFCSDLYHDTFMVQDAGFDPAKPFPISVFHPDEGTKTPSTMRAEDGLERFVDPKDWESALYVFEQLEKSHQHYDELRKEEDEIRSKK